MRNVCWRALVLTLAFAGFLGSEFRSQAQIVEVLLNFTSPWRYNQSGAEPGNAWRAFSFPGETAPPWNAPSAGLLGFEDAAGIALYAPHAPLGTTLNSSTTITTYYFRATFQFSGTTAGLSLVASNLIDDGAVIWLNGTEVGRFRVTTPNQNATTPASGSPAAEGLLEALTITNLSLLRQGANVMAVESHRVAAFGSGDMMHGMKLMSIRAQPLAFTTQPQDQTVVAGQPLVLSVAVSGGPATFRWYRNGILVSGATSPTYSVTAAQVSNGGNYYAVVTNSLSVITSDVARVIIVSDTVGPEVVDAKGDTNTYGARRGQTIVLNFNETLLLPVSTNAANFAVYAGSNFNTRVSFTNITHTNITAGGGSSRIWLWMSGAGWNVGSNYFVVINNVTDSKGNIIFPNTRVPVSWDNVTNLMNMAETWQYHQTYVFDQEVYSTVPSWYSTNPPASSDWWGFGQGILWYDPSVVNPPSCAGDTANKLISFQNQPSLFRRTFQLPVGFSTNGTFRLRFIVDDGMILYLNGKELYAHNAASNVVVSANTRARGQVDATCVTNLTFPLSLLLPRTNWIAAAVLQSTPEDQSDTVFGLEMDAIVPRTSPLPVDPPDNQLIITMTPAGSDAVRTSGQVLLSWPTAFNGYGLQYKEDLSRSTPWITVSNQANPYTAVLTGETRLYRLSKP